MTEDKKVIADSAKPNTGAGQSGKPNVLKLRLKTSGEIKQEIQKPTEQAAEQQTYVKAQAKEPSRLSQNNVQEVSQPNSTKKEEKELTYSQNLALEKASEKAALKPAAPTLRGIPQIIDRPTTRTTTFARPGFNRPRSDFRRPEGSTPYTAERRPYVRREGSSGERTYTPGEGRYSRPYTPREGATSERRPYVPREGGSGERRYTPYSRPYTPREGVPFNGPRFPRQAGTFIQRPDNRIPQTSKPGDFRPRPFETRTGGFSAPYLPEAKRPFDADKMRKKRTTDHDDNSRTQRNSYKEDEVNINVTDFVGRIDTGHLEAHMFRDAFVHRKKEKTQKTEALFIKRNIEIAGPMSIKDIAAKMAMRSAQVLSIARKAGLEANDKENIAEDILHIIVEACGHTPIRIDEKNKAQLEFPIENIDMAKSVARPPVVVVVGHVDHGKTSLLDRIRKSNIAKKEAGGITQNIGAYQVKTKDGTITFIDTPGHEAFTSMRSRGVQITDIAILVVSSQESIKPQTIEAISHIKAAQVPIIVAITKCDLHDANIEKVKTDLLTHEIVAEEFGGDVSCIPVSSVTGENIDKLLRQILLQAEIMELKANPEVEARGVVLESKINPKIGAVATLLVQQGTLKKMSHCIAHVSSGKIKAMHDSEGNAVTQALPSMPVEIIGFDIPPPAGSQFAIISDLKLAGEILDARRIKNDQETKSAGLSMSFENFINSPNPSINLILRADTQGSLEALKLALTKLNSLAAETKFVLSGVGGIKESDIDLAVISNAHIIGFNTKSNAAIKKIASDNKIKLIENEIIYHIVEQIEQELLGLIKPEEKELLIGTAKVQQVFSSSKLGNIAGCVVTSGVIKNGMIAKLMRGDKLITSTKIASLKRNKDDAKEVANGFECGIVLANFNEFVSGDEIQCYKIELVARQAV